MRLSVLCLGVLLAASLSAALPAFGQAPAAATGFFTTRQVDGKWWLIDPAGKPFISKGVTTVSFAQDRIRDTNVSPYGDTNRAKYGTEDAWRQAVAKRLIGWGFNSLGAWSDEKLCEIEVDGRHLVCAPTLNLGAEFVRWKLKSNDAWLKGIFPDVFDPDFDRVAHEVAQAQCASRRDKPWIMGWFTDNELRWGPDWRGKDELLTMFLKMPAGAPGRIAAVDLLKRRYETIEKFNDVWKTPFASWDALLVGGAVTPPVVRVEVYRQNEEVERTENGKDPKRAAFVADCEAFLGEVAEHYFRITAAAMKAADPNHLNFGARFAYVPPKPVIAAAAKYVDVVSFNCYANDPRQAIASYSVFGKPLIIGEFSFRAKDSGLPNTKGAGPVVETQAERAAAFSKFISLALTQPNLVGYHWFEHCDEPAEGRFDGENSNYGVVNIKDEPYALLVAEMTRINNQAEALHR